MSNLISGHSDLFRILVSMLILITFTLFYPDESFGQKFSFPDTAERVIMFSDRTLYVTGEEILFQHSYLLRIKKYQQEQAVYCTAN
jgi:hypothetical protein